MKRPRKGTFGGPKWQAGEGANRSRTVSLLRRADTMAREKFGKSGLLKAGKRPSPSLPKLPWGDDNAGSENA